MSREQIEEMAKDLGECHTIDEWAAREYGEAYTDFHASAEKMLDRGWIKQSEGEWIGQADGYADGELVYDVWNCSKCNHCIDDGTDDADLLPNYCPNCGAKMKGGGE